jgi:hypothetical protein
MQENPSLLVSVITTLVPLALMAIVFVFLVRYARAYNRYLRRADEHMSAMEQKTDRIVAAMEAMRDQRDKLSGSG